MYRWDFSLLSYLPTSLIIYMQDNQLALQAWHQKARDDEKEFVSLVKSLNNYSYKLK